MKITKAKVKLACTKIAICKHLECGAPLLDLHLPVEHDGCGDDDEVRPPDALLAGEVRQQGDGLQDANSIAQTIRLTNRAIEVLILAKPGHLDGHSVDWVLFD